MLYVNYFRLVYSISLSITVCYMSIISDKYTVFHQVLQYVICQLFQTSLQYFVKYYIMLYVNYFTQVYSISLGIAVCHMQIVSDIQTLIGKITIKEPQW